MPEVVRGEDEPLDSVLRRFKKAVERSGVLSDARRHAYYDKPSVRRKKKAGRRRRRG